MFQPSLMDLHSRNEADNLSCIDRHIVPTDPNVYYTYLYSIRFYDIKLQVEISRYIGKQYSFFTIKVLRT